MVIHLKILLDSKRPQEDPVPQSQIVQKRIEAGQFPDLPFLEGITHFRQKELLP